jgi:hypothetical protein
MQLLYAFASGLGINQALLVDVIEAVKPVMTSVPR